MAVGHGAVAPLFALASTAVPYLLSLLSKDKWPEPYCPLAQATTSNKRAIGRFRRLADCRRNWPAGWKVGKRMSFSVKGRRQRFGTVKQLENTSAYLRPEHSFTCPDLFLLRVKRSPIQRLFIVVRSLNHSGGVMESAKGVLSNIADSKNDADWSISRLVTDASATVSHLSTDR